MRAVGTVAMNTGTADRAYAATGFLKSFHGVTLHAVLVFPVLAWLLARRPWAEQRRRRAVAAAVGCYVAAAVVALGVELASL